MENKTRYVLELSLPKTITDDCKQIKLSFDNLSFSVKDCILQGEIQRNKNSKCVEDILPLINKWFYSIFNINDKSFSGIANKFVEAKLYEYNTDDTLFKKWALTSLFPISYPDVTADSSVKFEFIFRNAIEENDSDLTHSVDKYTKEYNSRDNKCKFCVYYKTFGGRCYECENLDWFTPRISELDFIIKRVTYDSKKAFTESERGKSIKANIDLHRKMYDLFNEYVERQKEFLDDELDSMYKKISDLENEYTSEMKSYVKNSISALYSHH